MNAQDLEIELAGYFYGGDSTSTTGIIFHSRMTKETFEKYRSTFKELYKGIKINKENVKKIPEILLRLLKYENVESRVGPSQKDILNSLPVGINKGLSYLLINEIRDGSNDLINPNRVDVVIANVATPFGMARVLKKGIEVYAVKIADGIEDNALAYGLSKGGALIF